MNIEAVHTVVPYLANYLPTVSKGTYDIAMSNTCIIFFLVQTVMAALVYYDASVRGLSGPMWAFITFTAPYAGILIYIVYIIAFGHTRFHIRKDPAAEEIKRKWEDTESTLDGKMEVEKKEKPEKDRPYKKDGRYPYRKL